MLPQYSYVTSFSSASGTICQITTSLGALVAGQQQPAQTQLSCQPFDLFSYVIATGSGVTGGTATFQVLAANSTSTTPVWQSIGTPTPITLAATTNLNGVVNGPLHGLRISISGLAGGSITYAEIIGSVRTL